MVSASRWREELAGGVDEQQVARLRLNTHTGRLPGVTSFSLYMTYQGAGNKELKNALDFGICCVN